MQYFTNVEFLHAVGNTPSGTPLNITPLKTLTKLKRLSLRNNYLPQNLLVDVIPHFTLLEELDIGQNRATDLAPILDPIPNLRSFSADLNQFRSLEPLVSKTQMTYLNANGNTLSNAEMQKIGNLTNMRILHINAIRPANSFSDLSFLNSLTNLEEIRLNNNTGLTTLEPLLNSKNTLQRMQIINNKLSKSLLSQIAQFTNVTEIRAG